MERRAVSSKAVFAVLAVTLALGFVAALLIHHRFARYSPRVAAHLPAQVSFAAWMNVEQTVGFDAFESQLLPLLEAGRTGPEPRLKLIERKTSLELTVDTHEIAFATLGADQRKWLLLLGGLFRRERAVIGVVRMLQELGVHAEQQGDFAVLDGGAVFTLASDGVLIFASDLSLARAAQVPSSAGSEWKSLLQKPGNTFSLISFEGGPDHPEEAKRLWLSVQPGQTFPALLEVVQSGQNELALDALKSALIPSAAWEKLNAPAGTLLVSAELKQEQFQHIVAAWGALMQSSLGRAFQAGGSQTAGSP